MSESLIFAHFLFFGERCEWIAHFAQIKWAMWANCSGCSPKMSDHERFAQVAHQKWATMSQLLRSLTKNEQQWANCSGRSPKMSESFVILSKSLIRPFFRKKTSVSLRKPMSEFPALHYQNNCYHKALFVLCRRGQRVQWRSLYSIQSMLSISSRKRVHGGAPFFEKWYFLVKTTFTFNLIKEKGAWCGPI